MKPYFPYDSFRPGQERMFDFIYNNLISGMPSFVHAPTGIGKTASSLGAVLRYAKDHNLKVMFLSNRHEHHEIVFDTLKRINKKYNESFKVTNILNKKLLCNQNFDDFLSGDFHDYCRNLRKQKMCYFYENTYKNGSFTTNAKLFISNNLRDAIKAEHLKSKITEFCPYEIILEYIRCSDVVLADYYYLFNPLINQSFFGKTGMEMEDFVVIVDEAHNLPERIRKINDLKLSSYALRNAIKEVARYYPDLEKPLKDIALDIEAYVYKHLRKDSSEEYISKEDLVSLIDTHISYHSLIDILYDVAEKVHLKNRRSFANSFAKFLDMWESEGKSIYRIISKEVRNNDLFWTIRLFDLDVASKIRSVISSLSGSIFMSATLTPIKMYMTIMGLEDKSKSIILPSPFPKDNHIFYIVRGVTSKYEKRTREMVKLYSDIISIIINNISFNTIVFFPSYELMEEILSQMNIQRKTILLESRELKKRDKEKMLYIMKERNNVVLFAVIGGNFYEGVDFRGDMAKVVVVVGIPFEKPDLYARALINYYDVIYGKGKEYGYVIPTLNKVIQSIGRIFRSERDKGVVFLLDERYLFPSYNVVISSKYPNTSIISHEELIREVINANNFLKYSINEFNIEDM